MSRIGKLPIPLPPGVTASISGTTISIKGTKGELTETFRPCVKVEQIEATLVVSVANPSNAADAAFWGLSRALIANMVVGVSQGYKKSLEIQGVGYKFELPSPTKLILSVGFSHKVEMIPPSGVVIAPDEKEKGIIHITGIDKQKVGHFAASVRAVKKPEPYKGKGVHYLGEHIRRKAGKTGGKK